MTHPGASTRPAAVANAVGLFYVSLVMGVVRLLIDWGTLTRDVSTGFALRVVVFTFGPLLLLIHFVNKGRNWARITLLVFYLIGIPLYIGPLLDSLATAPLSGIPGILQMVLQGSGLAMMFGAQARGWFHPAEPVAAAG
jgi:hypothetical protein